MVAFGSNVGDSRRFITEALKRLGETGEIERVSGLYESAPMYVENQPPFVNGALLMTTELGPFRLIRELKAIEAGLGRVKRVPNGPREIDLDIVLYGNLRLLSQAPELVVPHPRAVERKFVLAPLAELDPPLSLAKDLLDHLNEPAVRRQTCVRSEDASFSV